MHLAFAHRRHCISQQGRQRCTRSTRWFRNVFTWQQHRAESEHRKNSIHCCFASARRVTTSFGSCASNIRTRYASMLPHLRDTLRQLKVIIPLPKSRSGLRISAFSLISSLNFHLACKLQLFPNSILELHSDLLAALLSRYAERPTYERICPGFTGSCISATVICYPGLLHIVAARSCFPKRVETHKGL